MNHTKRQYDPLGRSTPLYRHRLHALCLAIAITGSAWPIHARSIRAAFDTVEKAVLHFAIEQPTWGQVRLSNELRKQGLSVSPAGVRSIWLRHDLEHRKKRLRALEAKMAQDGLVLTEARVAALEKAQQDKEAHGEFESCRRASRSASRR